MITYEKLVDILSGSFCISPNSTDTNIGILADRILAALEKEREGDILVTYYEQFVNLPRHKDGQLKGRLIFRPTKAKEAGL